ncbi:hypothetical protein AAVH_36641 [Aphelenchoides avenae]|nr:hypothetical protein AAVH_36641 [Aphelenchus avenae]
MEPFPDTEAEAKLKAIRDERRSQETLLKSLELTRSDYVSVVMDKHRHREEQKNVGMDAELKTLRNHSAAVIQRAYRRYCRRKRVDEVLEEWTQPRIHPSIGKNAELFEEIVSRQHPREYISLERIHEKMADHQRNRRKEAEKHVDRENLIKQLESLYRCE